MERFSKQKVPYYLIIAYICLEHVRSFKLLFLLQEDRGLLFFDVVIFFLAFGSLIENRLFYRVPYWGLLAFALSIELFLERSFAANSSFLYTYFVIAFSLAMREKTLENKRAFLADSARLLLFVCLFYAGLQKLFCRFYTEGNLLSSLLMRKGALYWALKVQDPVFADATTQLSQAYLSAKSISPKALSPLPITIPSKIIYLSQIMSMASLFTELSLSFLCLFKKTYHWWLTFCISLGLVLGIYALVEEVEFLALICILSYFANEGQGGKAKVFLGASVYFMIVSFINYRPFFLG